MKAQQRGVALAIVVWFLAAMALLVAGIVAHARIETGGAQLHLARAKAVAAGDGAMVLAMLDRSGGFQSSADAPLVSESLQRVGDLDVRVRIYPSEGFVDLNSAPAEILAALFQYAAKLPPANEQELANNVVQWRDLRSQRRSVDEPQRFYSLEDLLRVDGVTRTLVDGIRDFVIPGDWVRGGVDWSAAPQELFALLQSVSPELAEKAQRRREVLSSGGGKQGGFEVGGSSTYRVDALVEYGGRTWLRRRWMRLGSSRDSSLPWVILRNEAPRVVSGAI
ncbi:hypothetical protein [Haliea sp. E17]|uniref:hypothetical protein n=1 Tax=Haliea sp. E17 TaxID=3401576 RepID=UPI003AB0089C